MTLSIDCRIAGNQVFIDRVRKRISGEEEKIKVAQEKKQLKLEAELQEG